jgi:hypothetical protein
MKQLHVLFALLLSAIFSLSCEKDTPEEANLLEGTFTFTGISTDNDIYGFQNENGVAVAIPTEEIDQSIFDGINQVYQIDDITFLDDGRLSYTAYEIYDYDGNVESRTEESDYIVNDDVIEFTFFDEFGNDDFATLEIEDGVLIFKILAYVDKKNENLKPLERYDESAYFSTDVEPTLMDRVVNRDLDASYAILYTQRYEK